MTFIELVAVTVAYLAALFLVAYLTRARRRRVAGALAGGVAAAVAGVVAIALAEANGWWRVPVAYTTAGWGLILAGLAISLSPVYLLTWRVARRFGGRGVATCVALAAVIGPPRDYAFARAFPNWITFSSGVAPVLGVAVTYVVWIVLGHAVMRLVAGPAGADTLRGRSSPAASHRPRGV